MRTICCFSSSQFAFFQFVRLFFFLFPFIVQQKANPSFLLPSSSPSFLLIFVFFPHFSPSLFNNHCCFCCGRPSSSFASAHLQQFPFRSASVRSSAPSPPPPSPYLHPNRCFFPFQKHRRPQ